MMTVFDLAAKLRLDSSEYEKGMDDAEGKAKGFGAKFKSGLGTAAKAGLAAVGATTAAVGVLVKKSVQGYSNFQQMEGGVKKLYGNMGMSLKDYAATTGQSVSKAKGEYNKLEKAQNMVMNNAKNAYKTAGMSANQYMEMSTQFSASLINSLNGDTVKAAKQTDVAMKAISDNFNTFGGDITNIQNAYQGFAKQNYTMLDNLKLGYGGTKTEMQRLIADANEYAKATGQAANLSINSFSDIVTAIDLVQQKQKIAGTTAREGATTIEGSLTQLKAAWENLVTGFANPDANIAELVKNVVTTAGTAAKNIMPAIMQAVQGITSALPIVIQSALQGLPTMIAQVGVPMVQAGVKAVLSIVSGLTSALPKLIPAAVNIVNALVNGVTSALPKLIPAMVRAVVSMAQALVANAPKLITSALALMQGLVTGIINAIPKLIEAIPRIIESFVNTLVNNAPKILRAGVKLVVALAKAIVTSIPKIVVAVVKLAIKIPVTILKAIPKLLQAGVKLIKSLWNGIKSWFGSLLSNLGSKVKQIPEKVISFIGKMLSAGVKLIKNLWDGIKSWFGELISKFGDKVKEIPEKAGEFVSDLFQAGKDLVMGFWNGLKSVWEDVKAWWSEHAGGMGKEMKEKYKINSPSKVFRDIGSSFPEGLALGIRKGWYMVDDAMNEMDEGILSHDGSLDMGYTSGTMSETVSIAIGNAMGAVMNNMTEAMADSMSDAMNNINVVLDKRQFGKMTRKAVANAL